MVICGTFFFDLAQFLLTEKIGYATRYSYMNATSILDNVLSMMLICHRHLHQGNVLSRTCLSRTSFYQEQIFYQGRCLSRQCSIT